MIDVSKVLTGVSVNGEDFVLANPADYIIEVAELPNITFKLYDNAGTLLEEKTTDPENGGSVRFTVADAGTYRIEAYNGDSLLWSDASVVVSQVGIVKVYSTRSLDNYSREQIHLASQKGIAHDIFKIGAIRTYVSAGSPFNNHKIFIENIVTIEGKDYIDWRDCSKLSSTYAFNPRFGYSKTATDTAWSKTYSSKGGYKYSDIAKKMLKQGAEIYSQAPGVVPLNYAGTLQTGIRADEFYYTNGNGAKSALYVYTEATDSFAVDTDTAYYSTENIAQESVRFVKGYFKSVGTITEDVFNAGYYYTFDSSNYVYTRASTYASGTTYYGFYETLQEDGVVVAGLSDIEDYLVERTVEASAGINQTSYLSRITALVNLPAIEEIFGVNRTTTLKSGTAATSVNAYNLPGEGSKLKVYDDWTYLCTGSEYWTRSTSSSSRYGACSVYSYGYINYYGVNFSYGVRAGFRTC